MSEKENSNVHRASVWLKPSQVEDLRNAVYRCRPDYLQVRDDAIIALMYDAGLRVAELVAVDVSYLRDENTRLYLPGHVQKDYPTENSPSAVTIALGSDTTRVLSSYLANRWKDTEALFPSRSSDRITTQSVRRMLRKVARAAGVEPYLADGGRGGPDDVTPHALRHSVAWRMMNAEAGNTLYDVRNRLRHRSITTTERRYDHITEV
jgi:integrase/recombinase XerC/integrase/recombinase XerD